MCWQYCHSCTKADTAQHSTAGSAGFWVLFEPHLSTYRISAGLQEFQVLETLERFELKNISLMVLPHCLTSWQSFVRFTRGSLKPEAELLAILWALPQGIFFKWKGNTIQKGPQTVALENLWLAQILWSLMDLTKKFLTDQWWFGLSAPVSSFSLRKADWRFLTFMLKFLCNSIYKNL